MPYCFDYTLDSASFFGSQLITVYGYSFSEIRSLFLLD